MTYVLQDGASALLPCWSCNHLASRRRLCVLPPSAGLRYVTPYTCEFKTFAKKRWLGRTLWDVFRVEFAAYPAEYYVRRLLSGPRCCPFGSECARDGHG